jgi:hypothetical protein
LHVSLEPLINPPFHVILISSSTSFMLSIFQKLQRQRCFQEKQVIWWLHFAQTCLLYVGGPTAMENVLPTWINQSFVWLGKIKNKKSLFSLFIVNYKKRKRSQRQNVNNGRRKDFNEKEKSSHSHGFPKNHACTPTWYVLSNPFDFQHVLRRIEIGSNFLLKL